MFLLCSASVAPASDGALEINEVCATSTGCFAGDAAGYPVTITQSGRYQLTSNLDIPDENTTGIEINASEVDLDLRGFTIEGPSLVGTQTGFPPAGFGIGQNFLQGNATVRNGMIVGVGLDGINLGDEARVFDVTAIRSARDGIVVGRRGIVRHSIANDSGDDGIVGGQGCVVSENVSLSCDDIGIVVAEGCVVSRNLTAFNTSVGLSTTAAAGTIGYGQNAIYSNNGGSINPQVSAANAVETQPNLCAIDLSCP